MPSDTESFSHVSVINTKLVLWRRINLLTLSILGTRDMTFASIIAGTLGVHTGLVTWVVLVLSITMQLFVLLLTEVSFWIFNNSEITLCKSSSSWSSEFLKPFNYKRCLLFQTPLPIQTSIGFSLHCPSRQPWCVGFCCEICNSVSLCHNSRWSGFLAMELKVALSSFLV